MVLDRLFLWIFTCACLIGTALIIFQAPALYDKTKPIDVVYSKIAKKKLQAILWDTTTIQSSMTFFSKQLSEYKQLIDNNPIIMYKIYFDLLIIKFLLYVMIFGFFTIDLSYNMAWNVVADKIKYYQLSFYSLYYFICYKLFIIVR